MPAACETAAVNSETTAAGGRTLGDLPVNRAGLGATRPAGSAVLHLGTPGGREGVDRLRLRGEQGIAFVPFRAIAGDAGPRDASTAHDDEPLAVARAHDTAPAQIRLARILHRGPRVLALPCTGDPDHLTENLAAGALRLTAQEPAPVDAVHRGKAAGQSSINRFI
jgi:hypothetical protein